MFKKINALFIVSLLLFSMSGCNSSDFSDSKKKDTNSTTGSTKVLFECSKIELSTYSAEPFDEIMLLGIPTDDESIYAKIEFDSGETLDIPIFKSQENNLSILLPTNEKLTLDASEIKLILGNEKEKCSGIDVDLLAMPKASNKRYVSDLLDTYDDLLDGFAKEFGVSSEYLLKTPLDQLPVEMIPTALLATVLENRKSIDEYLTQLDDKELEFINAMLSKNEMLDTFSSYENNIKNAGIVFNLSKAKSYSELKKTSQFKNLKRDKAICGNVGKISPEVVKIDSIQDLSETIIHAQGLRNFSDKEKETFSLLLPGVGSLINAPAGLLASFAVFSADFIQSVRKNLLPSELTQLTYFMEDTMIEEDRDSKLYNDKPITWGRVKLYATNKGMNIDRSIIDFNTIFINSINPLKGDKVSATEFAYSKVSGTLLAYSDENLKKSFAKRLDELEKDKDAIKCFYIEPTIFGPYSVDDDIEQKQWMYPSTGDLDSVEPSRSNFREVEVIHTGTATLNVKAQRSAFPRTYASQKTEIEVLKKFIRFLPSTAIELERAGDLALVKFRVANSLHGKKKDVEVKVTDAKGKEVPFYHEEVDGIHTLDVNAPNDETRYPLSVYVKSLSKTLDLEGVFREGTQVIKLKKDSIKITPVEGCLSLGDEVGLEATFIGASDKKLAWKVVSGGGKLLTEANTKYAKYTASKEGQVTIRAYSQEDKEIFDEIVFSVGKCVGMAVYYKAVGGVITSLNSNRDCSAEYTNKTEDTLFPERDSNYDTLPEYTEPSSVQNYWYGKSKQINIEQSTSVVNGLSQQVLNGSKLKYECRTVQMSQRNSASGVLKSNKAGNRLDIDIESSARGECVDNPFGNKASEPNLGIRQHCITSLSGIKWEARYDFEIDRAQEYDLDIQFECKHDTQTNFVGLNNIYFLLFNDIQSINLDVSRYSSEGKLLFVERYPDIYKVACNDDSPTINIKDIIKFKASETSKDRAIVRISGSIGSSTYNPIYYNATPREYVYSSMKGYVSIKAKQLGPIIENVN